MNKKSHSKIIKKTWVSKVRVNVEVEDKDVLAVLTAAELAAFLHVWHQAAGLRNAIAENEKLRRDIWDKIGEKYGLDVNEPNNLSVNLGTGEIRKLFSKEK